MEKKKNKKRPDKKIKFLFVYVLVLCNKKMAYNTSSLTHPRDRLPQPATSALDTESEVNFQSGRFYIYEMEFESRIQSIAFQFWKIQAFSFFVKINTDKIINKGFVHGDLRLFSEFLDMFLTENFQILRVCFERFVSNFHLNF